MGLLGGPSNRNARVELGRTEQDRYHRPTAAMIICGVDPGLETCGYAVIRVERAGAMSILDAGVCRTDTDSELAARLRQIDADFGELLAQWPIDRLAIEQLYSHYKHPRTAVLMGHARGVIIATAARCGMPVTNLAATQVKKYLTGNGRASKRQMQQAVASVFGLNEIPEPNDVADALAIAYCCIGQPNANC